MVGSGLLLATLTIFVAGNPGGCAGGSPLMWMIAAIPIGFGLLVAAAGLWLALRTGPRPTSPDTFD